MTTNKNKTAIAPTYIIIKINEMYSHSSKNKRLADDMKLKTKNKTEYIEFQLKIANKELINNMKEKK